jgi:hypothetical protein
LLNGFELRPPTGVRFPVSSSGSKPHFDLNPERRAADEAQKKNLKKEKFY